MPSTRVPLLFDRFRRRAEREAEEPRRVEGLAHRAAGKLRRHRRALGGLREDVPTLVRLALAWARRDYRAVPTRALVVIVGALLYFVSPLDAIPDFIPFAGLLDDAAVLGYVLKTVQREVERFRDWEKGR
jgi:uncharacterized membrane protein YkvA (DUF1232 family)